MTLAEAEALAGSDPEHRATVARCRRLLGAGILAAVQARDGAALERAARIAGTYRAMVAAAVAAGMDRDALEELEEALAAI